MVRGCGYASHLRYHLILGGEEESSRDEIPTGRGWQHGRGGRGGAEEEAAAP